MKDKAPSAFWLAYRTFWWGVYMRRARRLRTKVSEAEYWRDCNYSARKRQIAAFVEQEARYAKFVAPQGSDR